MLTIMFLDLLILDTNYQVPAMRIQFTLSPHCSLFFFKIFILKIILDFEKVENTIKFSYTLHPISFFL